jgi:carboxyl-terminal processing protease
MLFALLLTLVWAPALAGEKQKLTPEIVANLVPKILNIHLNKREINVPFMRQLLKQYIEELDPSKSFFVKAEADAINELKDEEVKQLVAKSLEGDFSYFATMLQGFLDKQVARTAATYDGLEQQADKIKALAEEKAKEVAVAPAKEPGKPATGGTEPTAAANPKDGDDENEDGIRWSEFPANEQERDARLQKTAALFYRVNKTYLSDTEAMKLALQTVRETRKRWLDVKAEERTPVLFFKAFMEAMDPHTQYMDAEEDEEFVERLERSFFGIGVQIRACPLGAMVEEVIPGGPSERSGRFGRGDQIVRVDDAVLAGLPINKIVRRIKGPKDTEVRVTLLKRETQQTEIVTLKRDTINLADIRVKGKTIDSPAGPVGIVWVQTFYKDMHNDVKDRIQQLSKDKPLAALVLDLRDNHGGYLEEAVDLAGLFITTGPVVGERDASNVARWKSDRDPTAFYTGPMVVLVNQFSASASEIVAGTLKDYGRALIVGPTQTFGKGTVQRVISLKELGLPGEIKITTHQYFLAGGASVQQKGVEPDVVIPGSKLMPELLEGWDKNAVAFAQVKGALDASRPDVRAWAEWKKTHVPDLQKKSTARVENNQEYKDFYDIKKRKAKLDAEREKDKARGPNDPPPLKEKKDEKDPQADEAAAIAADIVPSWPQVDTQAAK